LFFSLFFRHTRDKKKQKKLKDPRFGRCRKAVFFVRLDNKENKRKKTKEHCPYVYIYIHMSTMECFVLKGRN